ncbi:MAG: PASTA domain-containing protein [Candidatus Marinimicrobia bacterium]|nr:PASTA domain-containing protein [Candidatus Neomarinimicrobiota bacterium]
MIKTFIKYIILIGIISMIVALTMDYIVMPIYIRKGDTRYLMNVIDRPLSVALDKLESEGFLGSVYDTLYTNNMPPSMVVDQFPKPNTLVKPGRTIRLNITAPEKLVEVPALVGQSRRSAEIILHQLGLSIDTVYTEFNPDYPKGTVAWQSPKGGDFLKKGHGVHLTISEGLPPNFYQVPNIFGLSKAKAEEELSKAGLKIGKVYYQQNFDLIPYTVLNQSIDAGTVLESIQDIDITVSVLNMDDIFNRIINQ